jgi:arylsulfatase A-like enzyme
VVTESEFAGFIDEPSGHGDRPFGRMVRTSKYKYIAYNRGNNREQFFDIERDPGEIHNLIRDPDHREEVTRHRHLLRAWAVETGDDFDCIRE